MVSPENIGQQFLHLYRGVNTDSDDASDVWTGRVGVHWTTDKEVAGQFASGGTVDGVEVLGDGDQGHILEAKVPHTSVNHGAGEDYDLGSPAEKEVPLLVNAPVTLVGIHHVRQGDRGALIIKDNPIPPMETRT